MTIDWTGYPIYPSTGGGPSAQLSRADTRARHRHRMAIKDERIALLAALTSKHGIPLENSYDCLMRLNAWYRDNVSLEPGYETRLLAEWYSFATDLDLFMGDCLIERYPWLEWTLHTTGKKMEAYESSVIRGYKVSETRFTDFDLIIAGWGNTYLMKPSAPVTTFATFFIYGEYIPLDEKKRRQEGLPGYTAP